MAVTLQQVADRLGISAQTVSCILRGQRERFRPETCQRVIETAGAMGYQPNLLSRALLGGKSYTIGLIARALGGQVGVVRLREAVLAARARGYLTYLINLEQFGDNSALVLDAARQLIDRRVDGLMVFQPTPIKGEALDYLTSRQVPVVFVDWGPQDWPWHLRFDHLGGLRQMAAHLAELGHRRVAHLVSLSSLDHPAYKIEPYRQALAEAGIEMLLDDRWLIDSAREANAEIAAYAATQRFLADRSEATALIFDRDQDAIGALAAITDAGLAVPGDLSVTGYDNISASCTCSPPLTTVQAPDGRVIGQRAFEMLHTLMTNAASQDAPPRARRHGASQDPTAFHFDLVVRASTGVASSRPRPPVPLEQLQAASLKRHINPDHLRHPPALQTSPPSDAPRPSRRRRQPLP